METMTQSKSARDAAARKRAVKESAVVQRRAIVRRRTVLLGVGVAVLGVAALVWVLAFSGSGDNAEAATGGSTVVPPASLAGSRIWDVTMETNMGTIELSLNGVDAPQAVASFAALSNQGFFDATDCHRLTTAGIFVLQCGDPSGNGTGGPSYRFGPIENAPSDDLYPAGTLAMARQANAADSMGSQFFIVYEDSNIPSDGVGGYTVFGTVTQGLDIVRSIANDGTITGATDGRPALSVIITKVTAS
jgi:peptidyl-prolyl cis-trans isomerase B (cyclophilin B)